MKIRSLTLKNIGVFEDETISFPEKQDKNMAVSTGAEIHILTGQNGTGKTTILQALASGVITSPPFSFFLDSRSNNTIKNFEKRFHFANDVSVTLNFDNGFQRQLGIKVSSYFNRDKPYISRLNDLTEDEGQFHSYLLELENEQFENERNRFLFNYIAFAYSGYRFVEHEDKIDIKEKSNYNPLDSALEFNKTDNENDYTLNQWLANNISKSALAQRRNDKISRFDENVKNLERIINEIIKEDSDERGIKFDINYEDNLKIVFIDKQGQELDFDLLPDGLRSIISWLGDLIMRMDALKWKDDLPIFEREFILFLDEIEVHLHPYWQRKILPVIQEKFKNAQIFITTHSPFIVNSVDGAWIYELDLDEKGHSKVTKVTTSDSSKSYQNIIRDVFEVSRFSESLEKELKTFTDMRNDILLHKDINENVFLEKAHQLANRNDEVKNTILFELRQLSTKTGKEFAL